MTKNSDVKFKEVVEKQLRENTRLLKADSMHGLIAWAKQKVVHNYAKVYGGDVNREWREAHVDSYGEESQRVAMYCLEGSPCKGWIIANYGTETVTVYDCHDQKICRQTLWEMK